MINIDGNSMTTATTTTWPDANLSTNWTVYGNYWYPYHDAARVAALEAEVKLLRDLVVAMAGTRTGGTPKAKRKRVAK